MKKNQNLNHNMITLGVDPSLCATGIVILNDGKIEEKRLIKTKPTGDDKVKELERLMEIVEMIEIDPRIDLLVMEGIAFAARNSVALAQLSGLNYFIRLAAYDCQVPFVICQATTLKKFATHKGNCPKDNVMMEVYKRWHVTLADNNICDAFVLAKIGEALLDDKVKLTQPQREVIELLRKQL